MAVMRCTAGGAAEASLSPLPGVWHLFHGYAGSRGDRDRCGCDERGRPTATPCIDATVTLGRTILAGEMDEGRTAERLGLTGMDRDSLLRLVRGETRLTQPNRTEKNRMKRALKYGTLREHCMSSEAGFDEAPRNRSSLCQNRSSPCGLPGGSF